MKSWREQFANLARTNTDQALTIASLERKVARLAAKVDALESFIQRKIR